MPGVKSKLAMQAAPARGGSDSDDDDDLFAPKKGQDEAHADHNADAVDAPDHSRVDLDDAVLAKWNEPGKTEQLRNRFVTGDSYHEHTM